MIQGSNEKQGKNEKKGSKNNKTGTQAVGICLTFSCIDNILY
jgi:hypothetical protein